MAREHEIFLFTLQPEEDFRQEQIPLFPKNVNIISTFNAVTYRSIFNIFTERLGNFINYRILRKTILTNTNSYFLKSYSLLLQKLDEIKPSVVLYENLESVDLFSTIVKKRLPSAKQIYDAFNVDSDLWKQLAKAQKKPLLNSYAVSALKAEKTLYKKVDIVFCCSKNDQHKLVALNIKPLRSYLIPNGVDSYEKIFDPNLKKGRNMEILFCGSLDYYPNEEGINWFCKFVFPLIKKTIPHIKLTLVGNNFKKENYPVCFNDTAIFPEGKVPDLKPYYYRASVSIAPLLSGSGTRLKILEAMSYGTPVVSTSLGSEGIDVIPGVHIMVANDPVSFANAIIKLLEDDILFNETRLRALRLVKEKYEWEKTGKEINSILTQLNF